MTYMTRSRLIAGLGALIGFTGLAAGYFHWPPLVAPWSRLIAGAGLFMSLYGAQGVRQALKDRQIDVVLKD